MDVAGKDPQEEQIWAVLALEPTKKEMKER